MNKILVGIHGRPSIKGVYNLMKNAAVELWIRRRVNGKEYWRVYKNGSSEVPQIVRTKPVFDGDTIIRWGNEIQIDHKNCKIYNPSKAVALASNKGEARKVLAAAGVSVPRIINSPSDVTTEQVIARPAVHAKGKNIVVLRGREEVARHMESHPGWYYAEFFPKEREVRAHVAFGKILALMEKPAPKDKSVVAWNRAVVHEEWTAIPWSSYHFNACRQAIDAVKALGLDTGGVDVMIKGDVAVVLEVNTAPTLISSPYVSQRYAEFFNWLFTGEEKSWIDYTKFTKAPSFSWKHSQLD